MIERLVIVGALVVLVVVVSALARLRPLIRPRLIDAVDVEPGTYFLTSDGCESCGRAREKLERHGIAYEEAEWQTRPELFDSLGVDAVPSLVVVDGSGRAHWWRGGVPRRLEMPRTPLTGG